ncbi:hypothetical protein [Kitasatospora sp. NBC_00039]|uniref:hypothetical protein n=1 Tax=Kitasatospora sp. NBC_00039 TaxID=2903565 RepID=UPI003243B5B0
MRTARICAGLGIAALLALGGCSGGPKSASPSSTTPTSSATQVPTATPPPSSPAPPTATPTPSTPAPPTATRPAPSPDAVVEQFYAAINAHDYQAAWALGGSNLGTSYATFVAGYAGTATDIIGVDAVHGDTVDVHLHAVRTDGSSSDYAGSYTVRNGVIVRGSLHLLGAGTGAPKGSLNPTVTQATIRSTICVTGWTATIRPSTSFTNTLKQQQLAQLGLADQNPAHYEEDHIVPLELGGAPMDPANLQPVPLSVAEKDDGAERSLHTAVCNGSLPLADAQAQILQLKTGEG